MNEIREVMFRFESKFVVQMRETNARDGNKGKR